MSLETNPTSRAPFFHPLTAELGGNFSYNIKDYGLDALAKRSLNDDIHYHTALNKSVETMVLASQHAELSHLTSFGLTDTAHSTLQTAYDRMSNALNDRDGWSGVLASTQFEISKFTTAARFPDATVVLPSYDALNNYVKKVIQEETVGEGILWLAEKAFSSYATHAAKAGSKGVLAEKSPFEACGVMNNGKLGSTDRLDQVIAALPDMLSDAGANLSHVETFDRNDPATNIRHRVWPVELTPEDTVAFYADGKVPDYFTLRRRRPLIDFLIRLDDKSGNERIMLGEGYKESFAQVAPGGFEGEHAERFQNAFDRSTVSEILGKRSLVAEVCGDVFTKTIDERDESTSLVVPTYTCLMFRFTDPFRAAHSPSAPKRAL